MNDSIKQRIEDCEGYYALPRITEDFEGDVIKLSARETNILFQTYTVNGDPYKFIDRLTSMDEWFESKPYKIYKDGNWMKYVTKWLKADKEKARQ